MVLSQKTNVGIRASVNRELACLKHMLKMAIQDKLIDSNPASEIKLLREPEIEMHILKPEEARRLIDASSGYLTPILVTALNTGMRRGEILSLRWNYISYEECLIHLRETKNNRIRRVPMNGFVEDALKGIKQESEFVFYNPETQNHINDVRTAFKAACRRADIIDLRFHDLRHTAATQMLRNGADIITVKEILGHSDVKMTMRYTHTTPGLKRKAVDSLASVYNQKVKEPVKNRLKEEINLPVKCSKSIN